MTPENQPVPLDFQAFATLEFCSNRLDFVAVPIRFDGKIPILIGKNNPCELWLWAPAPQADTWIPYIEKNVEKVEGIELKKDAKEMLVIYWGERILHIQIDEIPRVDGLNLRPLGLNISGDSQGLVIAGHQLRKNTFSDSETMVSVTNQTREKTVPGASNLAREGATSGFSK